MGHVAFLTVQGRGRGKMTEQKILGGKSMYMYMYMDVPTNLYMYVMHIAKHEQMPLPLPLPLPSEESLLCDLLVHTSL